jgi:aryl-alcohol dehydrogenase-like predicted oxidoreductase
MGIAVNRQFALSVATIAQEMAVTSAQLALAWLLSRDAEIAVIPGTRKIERLEKLVIIKQIALETQAARPQAVAGCSACTTDSPMRILRYRFVPWRKDRKIINYYPLL